MSSAEQLLFAKAALVGLSIAAPVGPVGLLTIQRTLRNGLPSGLATGMGAAVADALYGAVGAYGVVWLIQWLTAARIPLGIGGGYGRRQPMGSVRGHVAAHLVQPGHHPVIYCGLWGTERVDCRRLFAVAHGGRGLAGLIALVAGPDLRHCGHPSALHRCLAPADQSGICPGSGGVCVVAMGRGVAGVALVVNPAERSVQWCRVGLAVKQ